MDDVIWMFKVNQWISIEFWRLRIEFAARNWLRTDEANYERVVSD